MFRKELAGELLAMRTQDEPLYTGADPSVPHNPRFEDGTIQVFDRRLAGI
jgi:hypothetical protein